MPTSKVLIGAIVAILLGLFFGGAYWYKSSESKKIMAAVKGEDGQLVREHSPRIGQELLRVTLVEFLDPECESCRAFHPVVKSILKRYKGSIHYVVRYAPFHGNSKFAIKILEGARAQGKYWETLDMLFEKLPEWGKHHDPQPELIWTFLPEIGLDIDQLKVDMQDKKIDVMIQQDIDDGRYFRVRGTPTFFINGKPLERLGAEYLLQAIEVQLQ